MRSGERVTETVEGKYGPVLRELFGPMPPPRDGVILEATETGVDERGIPQFSVTDITNTNVTQKDLGAITKALVPSRGIQIARIDPLQTLHSGVTTFVPDYSPAYIEKGTTSLPTDGLLRVTHALEEETEREAIERLEYEAKRSHQVVEPARREATKAEAKQRIAELVGWDHDIRDTYRVGDVSATEVIPRQRVDPLFCVRLERSGADASLNRIFEGAFKSAMIGRIFERKVPLQNAITLGKVAGATAFNNCFFGDKWKWAELLFIGEIVYGDKIVNGFANIPTGRRR